MRSAPWLFLAVLLLVAGAVVWGVLRAADGVTSFTAAAGKAPAATGPTGTQALEPASVAPPVTTHDDGAQPTAEGPADAGSAPDRLVEATFELLDRGRHVAGQSLSLRQVAGGFGRVSRSTDVMGFARLELAPGRWEVSEPHVSPPFLEIGADGGRFQLQLLTRRAVPGVVAGRVIDGSGAPVENALVTAIAPYALPPLPPAVTDAAGRFTLYEIVPEMLVRATLKTGSGTTESASRLVHAPDQQVTLVMEHWVDARVEFQKGHEGWLRIETQNGVTVRRSPVGVWSTLPVGLVSLSAHSIVGTRSCRGQDRVEVTPMNPEPTTLRATCTEALVEGTVVDGAGQALPGVHLAAAPFAWPEGERRPPTAGARLVTDARGNFRLWLRTLNGAEPVYALSLLYPWENRSAALVGLGDPPVTIVAVPAGSSGLVADDP